MKTKKRILSVISVICALAIICMGAFAYFADTANLTESLKVGNVDITVDGDLLHSNNLNNLNPGDNDPELTTDYRPGADHELSFTITNNRNKSVITRTIIEVSGLRVDGVTALTEEELMNLILSEKANVTAQTTANTIASSDTGKQTEVVRLTPTGYSDNKLVYVVGGTRGVQDVLNGTGDEAETETGVDTTSLIKTFDIGLDKDTSADLYESATITLTVKVEAMQYRNTSDAEWDIIFEESYTTGGVPETSGSQLSLMLVKGSDVRDSVPEGTKTVLFTDEVAPEGTTLTDLSVAQDGGIVSWLDGTTYKISTQRTGVKIIANEDCSDMFSRQYVGDPIYNLKTINVTNLDTSNTTNMSFMFGGDNLLVENIILPEDFNTSKVTNMAGMFASCELLETLTLPESFDTSNVTDMHSMFANCGKLQSIDLSKFNTDKVTNMGAMFTHCKALNSLDLSTFNTINVTNMSAMFSSLSLTTLTLPDSFVTSNVTNMYAMFSYCEKLQSIDLSKFNTDKVTNMGSMFTNCKALNSLDLSNFNTQNVTNMATMFSDCNNLTTLNLSDNFITSEVTLINSMFRNCSTLTLNCSNWNVSKVTNYKYFNDNASGVTAPTWIN